MPLGCRKSPPRFNNIGGLGHNRQLRHGTPGNRATENHPQVAASCVDFGPSFPYKPAQFREDRGFPASRGGKHHAKLEQRNRARRGIGL